MREGLQSNFPHPVLQRFGCYFFILMKWLTLRNGKQLNDQDLIAIFEEAGRRGILNPENSFIQRPVDLMNLALGFNGYRDLLWNVDLPPDGTAIVRLVRPAERGGGTHFIIKINGQPWDTLDPTRPAAATWNFDSYRLPVAA